MSGTRWRLSTSFTYGSHSKLRLCLLSIGPKWPADLSFFRFVLLRKHGHRFSRMRWSLPEDGQEDADQEDGHMDYTF